MPFTGFQSPMGIVSSAKLNALHTSSFLDWFQSPMGIVSSAKHQSQKVKKVAGKVSIPDGDSFLREVRG